MAIETPVQVLQRLREQARQERLAQQSAATQRISRARPGRDRGFSVGQAFGEALAGGALERMGTQPEESEVYKQAQQRAEWMNVDPLDSNALKANIKASADAGDYEVSQYLTQRLMEAERLRLMQEQVDATRAKTDKGSDKKWKNWDKDFRNRAGATISEQSWLKDINDEEEEAKVTDAILARAESQWNQLREQGVDIPRERIVKIVSRDASRHFQPGILNDTFDFNGFQADLGSLSQFLPGGGDTGATTTNTQAAPPVGTIKDGHRFTGGDPALPANWEKLDTAPASKEEETFTPEPTRGRRGGATGTTKLEDFTIPTAKRVGRRKRSK